MKKLLALLIILSLVLAGTPAFGVEIPGVKGEALEVVFPLMNGTSGTPFVTGETVTDSCYYSDSQGTWSSLAIADTVSEIGSGLYQLIINATEMNHDHISCVFSSTNAADTALVIRNKSQDIDDVATQTSVDTMAGYVDTEVAAILADTNEIQTNQNWNVWDDGTRTLTAGTKDTEIDAIKTKTDGLNFTGTDLKATLDGETVTASSVTDKTGYSISGTKTTLDALNDLSAAEVNAEADTALADYDPPTKAELDSAEASIIANTPTAAENADANWDELSADHQGAGSTGEALNDASTAGNPWDQLVADNQGDGTFGALANTISVTQTGNIGTGVLQTLVTSTDSSAQTIVRGDTKAFTFNLGSSWDLTGKKVYFIAKTDRTADNSTAIVNRECTISDAPNGVATITLTATETATVGVYYAEVEVRDGDDTNPRTARQFILRITQDVRQ